MNYYKMIQDNKIIGVVSSKNFIQYVPVANCFSRCSEIEGQYVNYKGDLYRDTWMQPTIRNSKFTAAKIIPIEKEEYDLYAEVIQINQVIEIEEAEEEITVEEPIIDPFDAASINFIRESKIKEMSYRCRKSIEEGFDVEFYGQTKHFSLTIQDQLNLINLEKMAQTQSLIPYHADGEDVIFYTPEEINDIVDTANALKIYHTTYYNALKKYINALETAEEISSIEYGIEIPEQYQTEVFKAIGGN